MHDLGQTRSANRRDHLLQTPDTFVRTPLPGLAKGAAVIHIGPAGGAQFAQYTVEFESGGSLLSNGFRRFVYVLEGEVALDVEGRTELLAVGGYACLPGSAAHVFRATNGARVDVIERSANALTDGRDSGVLVSHEDAVQPTSLLGDADVEVRSLLPEAPDLDFAVNTMTYQPGAALPMVEVHVMEHGLLMLAGGGVYRLGDCWYPVAAGDFIWMAPFCPQWFGALGKKPAKYLIYKDWNQHPLAVGRVKGGEL